MKLRVQQQLQVVYCSAYDIQNRSIAYAAYARIHKESENLCLLSGDSQVQVGPLGKVSIKYQAMFGIALHGRVWCLCPHRAAQRLPVKLYDIQRGHAD
jgi:hypothetical protein